MEADKDVDKEADKEARRAGLAAHHCTVGGAEGCTLLTAAVQMGHSVHGHTPRGMWQVHRAVAA